MHTFSQFAILGFSPLFGIQALQKASEKKGRDENNFEVHGLDSSNRVMPWKREKFQTKVEK